MSDDRREDLLDLTEVEGERRPVKIDDGGVVFMAAPDMVGPRDYARLASMEDHFNTDPEQFNPKRAEEMEAAMTEAARIVLPEIDRERIDALPYMRRARLVEAFIRGLGSQPAGFEPVNREERRAAG